MSKLPFFLLPTLLASTSSLALDSSLNCNGHPSCEEMGYSKADVPGCKEYLYCLYDHSYKVCLPDCGNTPAPGACPTGTMTEAECSAQKGVIKDGTLDASGCGKCLTCDGDLYKRGTYNGTPAGFGCEPLNYNGSSTNSDMCCKPCECKGGTLLTRDNNKITRPNAGENVIYCVSGSVTLDEGGIYGSGIYNQPTHIHFLPSTCSSSTAQLTIKRGSFDKVTSKVKTIIGGKANNAVVVPWIRTLTLENGGEFYGPMGGNSNDSEIILDIGDDGGAGIIYDFTESFNSEGAHSNEHNLVKCIGFSTTRYDVGYLNFGQDYRNKSAKSGGMTGYSFAPGCNGAVCKKQDNNTWSDGHISSNGGICH